MTREDHEVVSRLRRAAYLGRSGDGLPAKPGVLLVTREEYDALVRYLHWVSDGCGTVPPLGPFRFCGLKVELRTAPTVCEPFPSVWSDDRFVMIVWLLFWTLLLFALGLLGAFQ